MATSIVGVDFGSRVIRAVELSDVTKSRPTIERYGEIEVPEGAILRGEVVEPNTVAAALRKMWASAGFKSKSIAMGIGNHKVLARDLAVPRMSRSRIRESLPFQVQDIIPMPVAEALLDFYPVEEIVNENGPAIQGLFVAAPKEAVLGNVRAARLAGLTTVDVDLLPFAVSRVALRGAGANGTSVLVDVGAGTTSVIIAGGRVPQFLRIIPTGSDDLTQALALRLETDIATAESLKRRIGLSSVPVPAEDQRALEIIYEITGDLLTSIRNTITYFSNTRPNRLPTQIILTGGGSALPGFGRSLGEFTRLPVAFADPFGGFAIAKRLDAPSMRTYGASAAAALGLAMVAA
ncbi:MULTISPECIES: type IV pilus assembly protein PilM [unclassified Leifsonia]|uniref:type IV pilus assembly protein PilM n=1 Tax=unclassified Leifsonia TaxID=2663824 RepID=UPI0006F33355|nr:MULTISPECIES: type IV pilus assembly protein PilM [unclassified Leifsonia]KQX07956.1 pilus assembly protein PilM [Leifsonia sp. Root1293]KRA12237.1 pilus assembly protein PilM [Leifsonia sp. Root60]